jgi:D-tyrosyl-tRNA(Tyr) deacylase
VTIDGTVVGSITHGLCVLLGIATTDTEAEADRLCQKIAGLRIFEDEDGRMNKAVDEIGGALLVISQFTLHGDCRKGRRPSFQNAAPAAHARPLYDYFVTQARRGPVPVETGAFQAHMAVSLINDGPVTLILDTKDWTAGDQTPAERRDAVRAPAPWEPGAPLAFIGARRAPASAAAH